VSESAPNREDPAAGDEEVFRLCSELVALGEGKAAVDFIRHKVNAARKSLPTDTLMRLRLLSQYAGILESTEALAEAEFIRAEALQIAESGQVTPDDAIDAFLKHGLLLGKMHDYDGSIARLKEAVRRTEEREDMSALAQQIILAQAWRGQVQAFEALGEFAQASNALDTLENVKRRIRFLVFSDAR
jgi:tetratricopeptide (TPR) repeat protein